MQGAATGAAVESQPNPSTFIASTRYRPIFVSFCQFRFILAHHQESQSHGVHQKCRSPIRFALLSDSIKRHRQQPAPNAQNYCKEAMLEVLGSSHRPLNLCSKIFILLTKNRNKKEFVVMKSLI